LHSIPCRGATDFADQLKHLIRKRFSRRIVPFDRFDRFYYKVPKAPKTFGDVIVKTVKTVIRYFSSREPNIYLFVLGRNFTLCGRAKAALSSISSFTPSITRPFHLRRNLLNERRFSLPSLSR
jgi:hypothetical protein